VDSDSQVRYALGRLDEAGALESDRLGAEVLEEPLASA
jgi:hypothetical protein